MIYDRTHEDVENAKTLRAEKVQEFIALTQAETDTMEKGTLTINALNRIENKQAELKGLLNVMGYWNTPITNKTWTYTGIFHQEEFQRIIDNVQALRNAFFVYSTTPDTPTLKYHFETINDIEKILYDLDSMEDEVKALYRECGNFECGGDSI